MCPSFNCFALLPWKPDKILSITLLGRNELHLKIVSESRGSVNPAVSYVLVSLVLLLRTGMSLWEHHLWCCYPGVGLMEREALK